MLLTLTTTHRPATDLGYLLVKHPDRMHSKDLAFGRAHVVFPEATEERCTAALLLDIDPIALVRGSKARPDFALRQYVNDRPYAATSFLSVAIAQMLSTAMAGRSKDRPELAATPLPLTARLEALPCRGGESLLRRLFEPLGYGVHAERLTLDARFPEWGESRYFRVELTATVRLAELLEHLYVLIPVLDDEKHYWVDRAEVEKLLKRGAAWLGEHPERELITQRYLRHQRHLMRDALARLREGEEDAESEQLQQREEDQLEKPIRLHDQRLDQVHEVLRESGAERVLDLGCGDGKLLARLIKDRRFREIVGVDVSSVALDIAERRLKLDRQPTHQSERVRLLHGSLLYRDQRLTGFDAAAVVEVIEHLEPYRLKAFAEALFGSARPRLAVVTTPNAEYNVLFETLSSDRFRHADHRFEWRRDEFEAWAKGVAEEYGYSVTFRGIGPEHEEHGTPSQMGLFERGDERGAERGDERGDEGGNT